MLAAMLSASCGQQPQTGTAEPTQQAATASPSPIPWATIEPPNQVAAPANTPQPQPSVLQPLPVRRAAGKSYPGVGVVRLINFNEGWIEIDHEEIKGLMPAMQMEWFVIDRALLKSVQVGDRVNFVVNDDKGTQVLTELKKAEPPQ
jgi:Cu/Ag efflux protein CusF